MSDTQVVVGWHLSASGSVDLSFPNFSCLNRWVPPNAFSFLGVCNDNRTLIRFLVWEAGARGRLDLFGYLALSSSFCLLGLAQANNLEPPPPGHCICHPELQDTLIIRALFFVPARMLVQPQIGVSLDFCAF